MKKYLIDILAVFIAFCALGFSIWQGMETRAHNKLSVRPYLHVTTISSKNSPYMGVRVNNDGIGPAIIKKGIVFVDRKPYDIGTSWDEAATAANINFTSVSFITLPKGAVIKEGQSKLLLSYLKKNQNKDGIEMFREGLSRLHFTIIYESIYKEEFGVTNLKLIED